jgi:hypothetical protein
MSMRSGSAAVTANSRRSRSGVLANIQKPVEGAVAVVGITQQRVLHYFDGETHAYQIGNVGAAVAHACKFGNTTRVIGAAKQHFTSAP